MAWEVKNIDKAEQRRSFEHGEMKSVSVGESTIARAVLQPGWRWSTDIKAEAGTDSCQVSHTALVISGRFHVRMDDGEQIELGPGDAHFVSPGHDAWVVGEEACVIVDFAKR